MWYKLDELEEKYGLSKLSVYKLITQEPELRQYFKSLEGVLQINEQGIGILLKHTSKVPEDNTPATYADNNTVVLKNDNSEAMEAANVVNTVDKKLDENIIKKVDEEIDLFAEAFNTKGSFFDEDEDKDQIASLEPEENFFSNIDLDYKEDVEEKYSNDEPLAEVETDFSEGLIFQDEIKPEEELKEPDEVNANVYDNTPHDDFFSDEPIDDSKFLDYKTPDIKEIISANENDFTMEGYVKALKEKLIIQNEQVRALSNYLDITKKLLVQDEKIVNIIEGMNKIK